MTIVCLSDWHRLTLWGMIRRMSDYPRTLKNVGTYDPTKSDEPVLTG